MTLTAISSGRVNLKVPLCSFPTAVLYSVIIYASFIFLFFNFSKVYLFSACAEFSPNSYVRHKAIRRLLFLDPIYIVEKLLLALTNFLRSLHNLIYLQSTYRALIYIDLQPFDLNRHRTYT